MGDKERESKREQKTAGKRAIEIAHKKGQRHKRDIAEAIEDEIYRYIYISIFPSDHKYSKLSLHKYELSLKGYFTDLY